MCFRKTTNFFPVRHLLSITVLELWQFYNSYFLYKICQVSNRNNNLDHFTRRPYSPWEKTDQTLTGGTIRLGEREREILQRKKLFSRNEAVIRQRDRERERYLALWRRKNMMILILHEIQLSSAPNQTLAKYQNKL